MKNLLTTRLAYSKATRATFVYSDSRYGLNIYLPKIIFPVGEAPAEVELVVNLAEAGTRAEVRNAVGE